MSRLRSVQEWLISRLDVMVLLICLSITYGGWQWGIRQDKSAQQKLVLETTRIEETLDAYVEHILDYARAIKGLYETNESIDQVGLAEFVRIMMEGEAYPSILRISEIVAVPTDKVGLWERQFKRENDMPDYRAEIYEGSSMQFFVARVVNQRGESYIPSGQNLIMEVKRRALIEQIQRGQEGGIAYVSAVANIAEYQGPGFVVSTPVYRDGELKGLINVLLNKEAMEEEWARVIDPSISWQWWLTDNGVIARGGPNWDEANLVNKTHLELPGEIAWGIDLGINNKPSDIWNYALGGGILFSFTIYAMVYALASAGVRAHGLATQMTIDLQKYKQALDSSDNHIIITDPEGVVIYANNAVTTLTGYSNEEVVGQTPRLWGKQMDADFYAKMWETIKSKRQVFQGEITNKRKDGKLYDAYATISPIINKEQLIGFVGVEYDITERKKQANELTRMNNLLVGRELKMVELKKKLKLQESKEEHGEH